MPLRALLLALASAFLHAGWNFWVKTSEDRLLAMWGIITAGGLLFIPVVVVRGIDPVTYPYLAASGFILTGYIFSLSAAYDRVDFSLAYPMARGMAPLAAALLGLVFLGEWLRPAGVVGLLLVAGSLLSMVGDPRRIPGIQYALLTGVIIAMYSVIDAAGARRIQDGLTYSAAVYVVNALVATPLIFAIRGKAMLRPMRANPLQTVLAGAASVAAYALVLTAALQAPVGLVSAVRETSVVIGAWLGTVRLGERGRNRRIVAAVGVVAGVVMLGVT